MVSREREGKDEGGGKRTKKRGRGLKQIYRFTARILELRLFSKNLNNKDLSNEMPEDKHTSLKNLKLGLFNRAKFKNRISVLPHKKGFILFFN